MRKNGLAAPYNAMQIGTWILLPGIVIQFLLFITPTIPSRAASVIVTLLFIFGAISSIYYAYMTSATDPIDPRLHALLKEKNPEIEVSKYCFSCMTPASPASRLPLNETSTQEEEDSKFCWVCQARVATSSMHCKFCNKCVSSFDHHCQWLNTCIGDANYQIFIKTIFSLCLISYLQVFCSIVVIVAHFNTNGDNTTLNWWFSNNNNFIWLLFTIIFLILNTAVALLITQLLYFHAQLYHKNITTYEYIIQDNAKRRDRERFLIALDNKRKIELRNNHNLAFKARLTLGQFAICKCIDPLQQNIINVKSSPNTSVIEESKSTESSKLTDTKIKPLNATSSRQIESLDVVPTNNSIGSGL